MADIFHLDGFCLPSGSGLYLSNWWEMEKLSDLNSQSVVKKTKSICARLGIPEVLVSDNGPQFVSKEFHSCTEQWGVDHAVLSPHHQQGNQKTESAVKNCNMSDKNDYCSR